MEENATEIECGANICSITFLPDGRDLLSGGWEGKIRRRRALEGWREVGSPMDAGSCVLSLAVSRDGKWIVCGAQSGHVIVWDAGTHKKTVEIMTHAKAVYAIDVSPDSKYVAAESDDKAVSVWSMSSGERFLGPWQHDGSIAGIKYSPIGTRIATVTLWGHDSIRIYDSRDGCLLVQDIPIKVSSYLNHSFTWAVSARGNEELAILSPDGQIKYLDMTTMRTKSQWSIHSSEKPRCIVLADNGKFIAASANSSISFWDTSAHHGQLGDVLQDGGAVRTISISPNLDYIASGGDNSKITIRTLKALLPRSFFAKTTIAEAAAEPPRRPRREGTSRIPDDDAYLQRVEIDVSTSMPSIDFLTDGTHIAGGGSEGKVKRWRIDNGHEVGTAMDAGGQVWSLAVSRDGNWIASGTKNGLVGVWNIESGRNIIQIEAHSKPISAIDISPDSTQITTGSDDTTAAVWSLASGERLLDPLKHDGNLAAVKYSPNGYLLATATSSHESVRIYKSHDGSLVADLLIRVGSHMNQSLAWSVTGRYLFALTKFCDIDCVDLDAQMAQVRWSAQDGDKARCIAVSSNGKFIAASVNSSVTFWDLATHRQIGVALHYSATILSMAISPDNRRIATSSDEKRISVQDLKNILPESYVIGKADSARADENHRVNVLALEKRTESNDNWRSSAIDRDIQQTRAEMVEMDGRSAVYSVAFLGGMQVASGGIEGKIRRWQAENGHELGMMDAGSRMLNLAVSRDGSWIVSGSKDGHVTVWSAKTQVKIREITAHEKEVGAVDISSDATRIATGSDDHTVCVWSIASGKKLLGPLKHEYVPVAVKYSFDSELIATATWTAHTSGKPTGIRVYKSQDGSLLFDVPISVNSVLNQSLTWSIGNEQLFALSKQGKVYCLDVASGMSCSEWVIHSSNKPRCITLASNGMFIATSANSSISFWDPITCEQIGDVFQYGDAVRCMSISEDNGYLVSGGDDKKITLRSLKDVLPQIYFVDRDPREPEIRRMKKEKAELGKTNEFLLSVIHAYEQKHRCEALYLAGNKKDAVESFIKFVNDTTVEVKNYEIINHWISDFTKQSVAELESTGNMASSNEKNEEALAAYSAALSLSPSKTTLVKWIKLSLRHNSAEEVSNIASKFSLSKTTVQQTICDVLEGANSVTEALEVLQTTKINHEEQWLLNFKWRCTKKLEKFGDDALRSLEYDKARILYSTALSYSPPNVVDIFVKRSRVLSLMGKSVEALSDADEAIRLAPLRHEGYERRYAVLHDNKRYDKAVDAFRRMLSVLEQSDDEEIRGLRSRYVDATETIRSIIDDNIRNTPRVLIDTATGRLLDKPQQAMAFQEYPIYNELVSSMTLQLDLPRIKGEVEKYYRYVMLSHKWEANEPLLQAVGNISVYVLNESPENEKLQKFCRLVEFLGFRWAWSDTCCVDKMNHVVLQESLVAMFSWYYGSSLTIVYLRGVSSQSNKSGDLRNSIWNTRAWTYQEYVASKVVRFYTEEWEPYLGLGLEVFNHRESQDIILEMEQATGVSEEDLVNLQLHPGLSRVRQKLHLASSRQTTLVEDMAYSLFGIFNVAITVIYGEGNRAVGRLLEHVVTGSGDVSVLAWTGISGRYNSCLPIDLTVYQEPPSSHVPPPISSEEMVGLVQDLQASLPDPSLAERLYFQLQDLPLPSIVASRLKLSGICFTLREIVPSLNLTDSKLRVYRATTSELDGFEVRTNDDLSRMRNLVLIHPWIHPLLDEDYSQGMAFDTTTRALRFLAYLLQPFGALLLTPISRVEYKRVATDGLIVVRIRKETPLTDLMASIRTIDIQ